MIQNYHTKVFARFVERMVKTPEGNGSLLDHSMVLYGSGMSNANDHTHAPLPLVVAGGGSGAMRKLGHHLASPPHTPMANLLLSLAQKAGVETTTFGASTEAMDL